MLQTIEVEIDRSGRIHPLEPLSFTPSGRAYLTLLPPLKTEQFGFTGSAAQALHFLSSARFSHRPVVDSNEVQHRIQSLRDERCDQ
jgi:hypothetical protein